MSLCRVWKMKCVRCDTLALHAREAEVHSMQWSPDVLETIWDKVRRDTGMWRANTKARLWVEVHEELLGVCPRYKWDTYYLVGQIAYARIEIVFKIIYLKKQERSMICRPILSRGRSSLADLLSYNVGDHDFSLLDF